MNRKKSLSEKLRKLTYMQVSLTLFGFAAALLQDCGRYMSLTQVGDCSYNIVMNTEIIGLSHAERQVLANIVRFNHDDFIYYEAIASTSTIDRSEYLIIAKLTAILRLACALDSSHKQKFTNVKITLDEGELILRVDTDQNIELEKGLFDEKAMFFEEVFNVHPVLKQKKSI